MTSTQPSSRLPPDSLAWLTFAGLWGVPYLVQVHGLERSHAAGFTTTMLLGFAVGGPLLGALSDRIGRRKLPYLGATLIHALGWLAFLLIDDLSASALYLLFATIGFTAGGLIIGFAFAREVNHPGAAGTVGGGVNMPCSALPLSSKAPWDESSTATGRAPRSKAPASTTTPPITPPSCGWQSVPWRPCCSWR